ncbi:hypothetical protein DMENIID0001_148170 [Sergentomyia squamirostris]
MVSQRNIFYFVRKPIRCFSTKVKNESYSKFDDTNSREGWSTAKPYKSIPGPSKWNIIKRFMLKKKNEPVNLSDIFDQFQKEYGSIFRIKGLFGSKDTVVIRDPKDFEITYRTEGYYPDRRNMDILNYCKKDKYPITFALITEHGENWWSLRQKINSVLLQPQVIKSYTSAVDEVTVDFLRKLHSLRDANHETPPDFLHQLNMWALESVTYITLNRRLGVLEQNPDGDSLKLIHNIKDFLQLFEELQLRPSIWKIYKTSKFVKFQRVTEEMQEIIYKLVDQSVRSLRARSDGQVDHDNKSIFEKFYEIDKYVAMGVVMDSIIGGIDTVSATVYAVLSKLALNPTKQNILRNEILQILPEKDNPLTKEKMINLPYLRACIKEAMRMTPVLPGSSRLAGQDIILKGYQIPKNTNILMYSSLLNNDDQHFSNPNTFMPERWIRTFKKDTNWNAFAFLPFGFGTRSCIGRRLAELEIEILISRMVRNYHMEWHVPPPKMRFSTVNLPQGDIKLRLQEH